MTDLNPAILTSDGLETTVCSDAINIWWSSFVSVDLRRACAGGYPIITVQEAAIVLTMPSWIGFKAAGCRRQAPVAGIEYALKQRNGDRKATGRGAIKKGYGCHHWSDLINSQESYI